MKASFLVFSLPLLQKLGHVKVSVDSLREAVGSLGPELEVSLSADALDKFNELCYPIRL